MSDAPARLNAAGTDQDNWDDHWETIGEFSKRNPANDYRHKQVLRLLGDERPGSVLLDIGSGQGQFAIDFQRRRPDVRVFGVEYSAQGVRRANEQAAREGLAARPATCPTVKKRGGRRNRTAGSVSCRRRDVPA